MISDRLPALFYGGDYNPEQWPEEIWADDMRLMKEAGVNIVTVAVFSWALLEPEEGRYEFGWLDRVMDLLDHNGIRADMATATAAQPAWLSRKYDDVLPLGPDGKRYSWGSRQTYCPNSPSWRAAARRLVEAMATRYAEHPALALWHVNNEYTCHVRECFCDNCAAGFRTWLTERYGSLDNLNQAWGTAFWSQHYYDCEEILPPGIPPPMPTRGSAWTTAAS